MRITITKPTYYLTTLLREGQTIDLPRRIAANLVDTGRAGQASSKLPPELESQEEKWLQSTEMTEL